MLRFGNLSVAMLKVKDVSKSFGSIKALSNINFEIEEGEFVFLTGPSGAGKTTLLRLLIRELLPDEGEIFLADEDITKLPRKNIPKLRQNMGVVFQDFKVLPERTVRENIEVALAVIRLPSEEWRDRVEHVLKLVGLNDRAHLFPSQLSGGELQRASLARALVVNPKILIADEPTGNLDWTTSEKLMDLFAQINAEGKTVLMSTHHEGIMERMKKRVIVLDKGTIHKDSGGKKSKKVKTKSGKYLEDDEQEPIDTRTDDKHSEVKSDKED